MIMVKTIARRMGRNQNVLDSIIRVKEVIAQRTKTRTLKQNQQVASPGKSKEEWLWRWRFMKQSHPITIASQSQALRQLRRVRLLRRWMAWVLALCPTQLARLRMLSLVQFRETVMETILIMAAEVIQHLNQIHVFSATRPKISMSAKLKALPNRKVMMTRRETKTEITLRAMRWRPMLLPKTLLLKTSRRCWLRRHGSEWHLQ